MVTGKIICAIKNADPEKRIGKRLLNSVYEFILEKRVETWKIYSLPFPKLVAYYESFGFKQHDVIYMRGKAKVVEIKLLLIYDKENVTDSYVIDNTCELDDNYENGDDDF